MFRVISRQMSTACFLLLSVGRLDKPAQKQIAGAKQEEQNKHHGGEFRQYCARAAEQHAPQAGPFEADAGDIDPRAGGQLLDFLARFRDARHGLRNGRETLFQTRKTLRGFRNPFRGRTRQGKPDAGHGADEDQDDEQRRYGLGNVQLDQRRHRRLKQEIQQESEDDRQNDLAGEIEDDEHEKNQNRGRHKQLRIPRQRQLARFFRLLRE